MGTSQCLRKRRRCTNSSPPPPNQTVVKLFLFIKPQTLLQETKGMVIITIIWDYCCPPRKVSAFALDHGLQDWSSGKIPTLKETSKVHLPIFIANVSHETIPQFGRANRQKNVKSPPHRWSNTLKDPGLWSTSTKQRYSCCLTIPRSQVRHGCAATILWGSGCETKLWGQRATRLQRMVSKIWWSK